MLFGCASDEQFNDELYDELSERDYDLHYCEKNLSYYCKNLDCQNGLTCPFDNKGGN